MRVLAFLLGLLLSSATVQGAAQTSTSPGCGGQPGLPAGAVGGVFRGTVAGQPAVLELLPYARYTYEKTGLDIELEATYSGSTLILQESEYDRTAGKRRPRACLRLAPGTTGWTGTWTKAGTEPARPVVLKRLNASALPFVLPATPGLQKLRRDDPYSFLKINRAWNPSPDGTSVREPRTGLSYPRLPGESAALNGALQDRHAGHVLAALECRSGTSWSDLGTDYELELEPRFLTPKLLSFMENVGSFCGGAHPNFSQQGVILDRLTGEEVGLSALWPSLTPQEQHRLYLANLPGGIQADCLDVLNSRSDPSYTGSLLKVGLQLIPNDLPHLAQACAGPVVVGYPELRDLSLPGERYFSEFYRE